MKHVYGATIVGSILIYETSRHESIVREGKSTTVGSLVATNDTVAHVSIVSHDGSTTILIDVGSIAGKTAHLSICIATSDIETVDDGTVIGLSLHRHQVVTILPCAGLSHSVAGFIRITQTIKHTVGEGHHVIGVDILFLTLIIIIGVEVGRIASDIALVSDHIGRGVLGVEAVVISRGVSVGISTPHFHTAWHHDRPYTHTLVALVSGATSVIREVTVIFSHGGTICHLHDDSVCRACVFVATRSIEHLLQFASAGSVCRTISRCCAVTLWSDIEYAFFVRGTSSDSYLGLDVERLVVFVGTLVNGTVLDTVFTIDVHRDVIIGQRLICRTLIDTLRGSRLERVVSIAVGIAHKRFVGFAIGKEGTVVGCIIIFTISHNLHIIGVGGIIRSQAG